jgi:hypothetical protein
MIARPAIFKWRQTEPDLILCAARWYLRYSLSLRDVEELLEERGASPRRPYVVRPTRNRLLGDPRRVSSKPPSGPLRRESVLAHAFRVARDSGIILWTAEIVVSIRSAHEMSMFRH